MGYTSYISPIWSYIQFCKCVDLAIWKFWTDLPTFNIKYNVTKGLLYYVHQKTANNVIQVSLDILKCWQASHTEIPHFIRPVQTTHILKMNMFSGCDYAVFGEGTLNSVKRYIRARRSLIAITIFGRISNRQLTHRGRVTHICIGKLTIIDSDNG